MFRLVCYCYSRHKFLPSTILCQKSASKKIPILILLG